MFSVLADKNLRFRLIFGLALLFFVLLTIVSVSVLSLDSLISSVDEIVEEYKHELAPTDELEKIVNEASLSLHRDIFLGAVAGEKTFEKINVRVMAAYRETFRGPFEGAGEKEKLRKSFESWQRAAVTAQVLIEQIAANGRENLDSADLTLLQSHLNRATTLLEELEKEAYGEINDELNALREVRHLSSLMAAITVGIAMAVIFFMVHFFGRSIIGPLRVLETGASRLGSGDLGHRVYVYSGDELGRLAASFNRMADQLQEKHDELKRLSTLDYLTGLDNAREFYLHLENELERSARHGQPFSLLIVDTDHFKKINDSYGHQAGDSVLKEIARILKDQVRKVDHLARVGGEEFGIILPMSDIASAAQIGERIRQAIAATELQIDQNLTIRCTVSIGCASFPEDGTDGKVLFARADQALYAAKRTGRNRVCSAREGARIPLPPIPAHLASGYHA